jgi:cytosine/adenosine deaminase-related metal-dependent hydrolase
VDAETFSPPPATPFTVRARWVFPVSRPPLAGAAIEVGPGDAQDLGHVAILPGFVNAHAHLEFSELTEPLQPARPFSDWLRALLTYRRRRGDAERAIRAGLEECRQRGTIAVGDIDTRGNPTQYASAGATHVLAFRELLGLDAATVALQLGTAQEFLEHPPGREPGRKSGRESGRDLPGLHRGLSPHAPFTVNPRLLEGAIALALKRQAPLAIHLAETRAELECLASGTGELVDLLSEAGIWQGPLYPAGTRPLDLLRRLEPLPRVVIAHGNYLADDELAFLATRRNFALVYCPRTHDFFGHADHPWQTLLARGGIVAVGTDGRCSNPDLSIWHELQFLRRRFPEHEAADLLRLGTINGALAMGLDDRLGTIEPGKSPGLAVVRLGRIGAADAYDALFHENSEVVNLVVG